MNKIITSIIVPTVSLLPVTCLLGTYLITFISPRLYKFNFYKRLYYILLCISILWYLITSITYFIGISTNNIISCTHISSSGHQVWPTDMVSIWFTNNSSNSTTNTSIYLYFYAFFYFTLFLFSAILFRPGWMISIPFITILFPIFIDKFFIDTKHNGGFSSEWCWSASFTYLWFIAIPYIPKIVSIIYITICPINGKYFICDAVYPTDTIDPERDIADDNSKCNCCLGKNICNWFFIGTSYILPMDGSSVKCKWYRLKPNFVLGSGNTAGENLNTVRSDTDETPVGLTVNMAVDYADYQPLT